MVQTMKEQALYKFEVHFSTGIPKESFNDLQGVQDLEVEQNILRCTIKGKPDALIKSVARFEVLSLVTYEPSLEDIFLSYYGEGRHNAP